jgi:predicted permease
MKQALNRLMDDAAKVAEGTAPILRYTWLTLLIALLGAVAISAPDQAHEALRIMAEERGARSIIVFFLATLGASLLSWYCARLLLYLVAPTAHGERGAYGWAARNLPRLAGMIPFVGASRGFNMAERLGGDPAIAAELRRYVDIMAVVALATFLFFVYRQPILKWVRERLGSSPDDRRDLLARRGNDAASPVTLPPDGGGVRRLDKKELPRSTLIAVIAAPLLWVAVCAWVTLTNGRALLWVGPLGVILISIASWIIIGNTLLYVGARLAARFRDRGARVPVPIVTLVFIYWVAINAWNLPDNHALRQADGVTEQANPPRYTQALTDWLATRADRPQYANQAYPVFLVAAEGGGLRNAYITAVVLGYLQDWCPAFTQHTFAVTSVSGGSVGAAVYGALAAARRAPNEPNSGCPPDRPQPPTGAASTYVTAADSVLGGDLLTPLLAMGLYPDFAQRFIPASFERWDRARGLELALEHDWRAVVGDSVADAVGMSRSFYELIARDSSVSVPVLMLNTTHVQTGQRMVVSHVRPDSADFNGLESLAALDASLHPPLSSAAFLSARFPFVTPEGTLTARGGSQRYVDGGYFDNSGATTVAEMLTARPTEPLPVRMRPVVVLVGFTSRKNATKREKYTKQGLNEALTPLRTLMNTRDARGDVAVAQLQTLVERMRQRGDSAEIVEIDLAESGIPLPLGWVISDATRRSMRDSLAPANYCRSEEKRRRDAGLQARPCGYERIAQLLSPAASPP